ncbi:MAG: serine--tRNA ligase [Deltaproteobacteria bacterium]|nr:MAG: serine--tRNA ligase [Deltaproteobacteria bacterium]
MLDLRILRDDPDLLRDNLAIRKIPVFDDLPVDAPDWAAKTVDRLRKLDEEYRRLLEEEERLRHEQKRIADEMKALGRLPRDEQAARRRPLVEEGRTLRERERLLADRVAEARAARDAAWSKVPNLTHPDAPRGDGDDAHRELRRVGTMRDFEAEGFAPKDHLTLAEGLGIVDFEAGAKVAGQKFYYLVEDGAMLDLALQMYALEVARRHGFRLHVTPDLARAEIVAGLGFQPRGPSTQIYSVEGTDLCLVGTAEITLGGMLADEILDAEDLPILLAGLSHCFRTEAGSAGQESKGLYRVHQFTKVELFAFTHGDVQVSDAMHRRFLDIEIEIFEGLGIPFRVLDMATGDLAAPAYRKYDLEAHLPGRGGWGEITSTSNCTDYQARRLKIRYRDPEAADRRRGRNRFVHMVNGTAVATSRAIVAILEHYQQADGSVVVPEVLRRWVGKDVLVPRA